MSKISLLMILLVVLLTIPSLAFGDTDCLTLSFIPDNATGLPQGWKHFMFSKIHRYTSYTVENDSEHFRIRAESHASASALFKELHLDPKAYPIIRWRWKVKNIIQKGDEAKKAGDDYAARVYVNFRYDPEKASFWERVQYEILSRIYGGYPPKGTLSYVWANKLPQGMAVDNVYSARSKIIAVESGPKRVGEWVSEERIFYQDYLALFGEEPPFVSSVAIMTDTDNTQEMAVAYYGEISLCRNEHATFEKR